MTNYYLDTSIWVDYYENRSTKFLPLGDFALSLINKIIENKDQVFYSEHMFKELSRLYELETIRNILSVIIIFCC
jgi:predicted nucleic acid-binding protein